MEIFSIEKEVYILGTILPIPPPLFVTANLEASSQFVARMSNYYYNFSSAFSTCYTLNLCIN